MSTSALSSLLPTTSSTGATASSTTATATGLAALKPEDFIQMMITQLKNQDPTDPTSNEEILSQISQIGQLQSSDTLEADLSSMVLQNSISSAGSLIGKKVNGVDDSGNTATGLVNSVNVTNNKIYLQLDSGSSVQLANVSAVSPGSTSTTATTGTGTATTTGTTSGTGTTTSSTGT